jgi:hypothetical protein
MPTLDEEIYLQPIIVSSSSTSCSDLAFEVDGQAFQTRQLGPSQSAIVPSKPHTLTKSFMKNLFSSIPVISHHELKDEYRDLGNALSEMTQLGENEEWQIERPVFEAARYVAGELRGHGIPSPRLLSHGNKSVVFNWTMGKTNLYLTISGDRLSALVSTPERIQKRLEIDYSGLPQAMSTLIASAEESDYRPLLIIISGVLPSWPEMEIVSSSNSLDE